MNMIMRTMLVHGDTATANTYFFTSRDRGTIVYYVDGLMQSWKHLYGSGGNAIAGLIIPTTEVLLIMMG